MRLEASVLAASIQMSFLNLCLQLLTSARHQPALPRRATGLGSLLLSLSLSVLLLSGGCQKTVTR